ncbi:MAG: hypothetical protein IKK79_06140 [Spirochaetaceae bacterium]|nr:hypothetical protein [Spirochaetaceae bacterium]
MKCFFLLLLLCPCWLMISCASTPPVEESVLQEEAQVEQSLQNEIASKEGGEQQGSGEVVEDSGLQGALTPARDVSELSEEGEEVELTEDDLSSAEEETEEDMIALLQPDDNQDYLQEIEIIDLMTEDELQAGDFLSTDDMAVILEDESALVVETPNLTDEEIPPPEPIDLVEEDKALVVEQPEETSGESEIVDPSNAVALLPDSSSKVEEVIETVPETQSTATATVDEEPVDSEQVITQENTEPVDVNSTQGVLDDIVSPSRSVVMDKNQYLDIRYPGTGWVYLGEVTEEGESIGGSHMTYFGRRRTSEDTSFTMRSTKPGTTILHFFRQDVLSATFIDDFLEVTITGDEAENGLRIVAPSYEKIVPGYQDNIPQPRDFVQAEAALSKTPATEPNEVSQPGIPVESVSVDSAAIQTPAYTPSSDRVQTPAGDLPLATTRPQQPVPSRTQETSASPQQASGAQEISAGPQQASGTQETSASPLQASGAQETSASPLQAAATTTQSVTTTTQATTSDSAPMIVPPRSETATYSGSSKPSVQSSPLQQELYEPETSSSVDTSQDNYNPQTGLSMDDLSLPWVTKELEEQRTADIKNPSEISPSQEEQLDVYEEQDALLAQAQEYFYEENYPASLETLNKFFEIAVKDFDAAYYLKGQVLESKSPVKNVKEAKKAYKHVIDSYPQSPFWERSQNRFTYLNRFYFDIR